MHLPDFALERWFARYEFNVEYNLAASCASSTTTRELLELDGDPAFEAYQTLNLDYIPNPGGERLRRTLASQYEGVGPDEIQVTTGASEGIFLLMSQLLESGDNIVVQKPLYQSLYSVAASLGVEIREWPLLPEKGWRVDFDRLPPLLDERTRFVVVNNPHSPTGAVMGRDELRSLVDVCEREGILLVSDEVYRGIGYSETHPDLLPAAVELSESALSIGDVTKPYGLGGLRVGWIACRDRSILKRVAKARDYTTMCSAAPSEFLAEIAVRHREHLWAEKRREAETNLLTLEDFFNRREGVFDWAPPHGGFTLFPKLNLPIGSEAFCRRLAEEYGVLLLPGTTFGMEGHVRFGIGMKPPEFEKGLARLEGFISTLA